MTMLKNHWRKILLGLLALVLVLLAGAGIYWKCNEARLRQEFAAYRKTGAPVLMYHSIGSNAGPDWPKSLQLNPQLFEEHLRYLREQGYNIVTVEALAKRLEAGEDVEHYIALSFDDGYEDNFTTALPIMQKYEAHGSFFVINKNIGKKGHMDVQQIKGLIAAGNELGSHTYSHVALAGSPEKYLAWELSSSRYYLKTTFDRYVVRTIAYPNGSYNKEVIDAGLKYGFYRGLTGHIGLNTSATYKAAPMEMYRVTVADDGNGLEGFKKRLEQAYFWGFVRTKGFDINWLRDLFI